MANMDTRHSSEQLPRLSGRVSSEVLQENVNVSLHIIHTVTITENNKLTYTSATVILKLNVSRKGQYPTRQRWLVANIKPTQREVSQLSELEKGKTTKIPKTYKKLSITEPVETAKHTSLKPWRPARRGTPERLQARE